MNEYLRQHPQIFMPSRKDISFFGADLQIREPRFSNESYLSLFRKANDAERVGETSVWYLYSRTAAEEIKCFSPTADIIVMLRNPVDMLYALHSQFLFDFNEDIVDFETALNAEEMRKRGEGIPRLAHLIEGLYYRETVKYSEQIERYFDVFGREKVHIILFDDLKSDVLRTYKDTLSFLCVSTSFCPVFRIINRNKAIRSRRLQEFLVAPPPLFVKIASSVIPTDLQGRLMFKLKRMNSYHKKRLPLDPAFRRRLQAEFQAEVSRLSQLLGRDLSSWSS